MKEVIVMKPFQLGYLIICLFCFAGNSRVLAKYEMSSILKGPDREVKIDGESSDWTNALGHVEDQDFSIGLMNGSENLYLCLVFADQAQQRHILRRGITVWLDKNGGKKKNFGIRFPLGMKSTGLPMAEQSKEQQSPEANRPDEQARQLMEQRMLETQTDLEILGPKEDDVRRLALNDAEGIELKMSIQGALLIYELKVPMANIRDIKKNKIGLGLETEKLDLNRMRGEFGGRPGGGGPGGMSGGGRPEGGPPNGGQPGGGRMGGGRRGGMGRFPGGERPKMAEPLKIWISAELATSAQ